MFYWIGSVLSVILFYLHTYLVKKKTGISMLTHLSISQVIITYGICFFTSWLGVIFLIYSIWESKKNGLM